MPLYVVKMCHGAPSLRGQPEPWSSARVADCRGLSGRSHAVTPIAHIAEPLRIELRSAVLETAVLPLHHVPLAPRMRVRGDDTYSFMGSHHASLMPRCVAVPSLPRHGGGRSTVAGHKKATNMGMWWLGASGFLQTTGRQGQRYPFRVRVATFAVACLLP